MVSGPKLEAAHCARIKPPRAQGWVHRAANSGSDPAVSTCPQSMGPCPPVDRPSSEAAGGGFQATDSIGIVVDVLTNCCGLPVNVPLVVKSRCVDMND